MMRQTSRLLTLVSAFGFAAFLFCPPLEAQRRSLPSPSPYPDADGGLGSTRARAFSISGAVMDAESHVMLNGVRVDLQAVGGAVLATGYTSGNGNFQFNNVGLGAYEIVFDQTGYADDREHVEVDGPVFGMSIQLRRVGPGADAPGTTKVSVRDLSIPHKAREAMNKGMSLLYQKSDYPGSIKQFQRAIQAYPDYYEAYAQIGLAYMKMKNEAQSEQALRKSIELSKEQYPDPLVFLAALLSSDKRFEDAEPLARKAVELDADSWHAQSELARALLGLERPGEGEKCAEAAVKLQPENPFLRLLLADAHIQLRNDPALLDDLNSYLKLAPNGPFAPQALAEREKVQQRLQKTQASPPPTTSQVNP